MKKVICIANCYNIEINKIYLVKPNNFFQYSYDVYSENGDKIGLFYKDMFKSVKQYRNNQLNELLS